MEYPIGHARRRTDGMPKLVEKFKINLARQFPTRQQQRIWMSPGQNSPGADAGQ